MTQIRTLLSCVVCVAMLDLQQEFLKACGPPGTPSKCTDRAAYDRARKNERELGKLLYKSVKRKGTAADEALVVLMCFYIGESQEELDEVIRRGGRMLKYLNKYQHATPMVPERNYPDSMLTEPDIKADYFAGAIQEITKGRRSHPRPSVPSVDGFFRSLIEEAVRTRQPAGEGGAGES